MLKMVVALNLVFSASAFANSITCVSENTKQALVASVVDTQPNKDYFADESMKANITIHSIAGKAVNASFKATGRNSKMAAGEAVELDNKERGFHYEWGFNGSELNGWNLPESITYQGIQYLCK